MERRQTSETTTYEVDRHILVPRAISVLVVYVAGGVAMLWVTEFSPGVGLGTLVLGLVAAAFLVGAARSRVELGEHHFRAQGALRKAQGQAGDFVGYASDETLRRWTLVRRTDLSTVGIPWLTDNGTKEPDDQVAQWLSERLAWMPMHGLSTIEKNSTMGEGQARTALEQPIQIDEQTQFVTPDGADRELAAAARAAWKYRYPSCRQPLEDLVLMLPWTSLALVHVLEALRRLGTRQTVDTLKRALAREECPMRERMVTVVCDLATAEDSSYLRSFQHSDSPLVRRAVKQTLARWD